MADKRRPIVRRMSREEKVPVEEPPPRNRWPVYTSFGVMLGFLVLRVAQEALWSLMSAGRKGDPWSVAGAWTVHGTILWLLLAVWGMCARSRWTIWGYVIRFLILMVVLEVLLRGAPRH